MITTTKVVIAPLALVMICIALTGLANSQSKEMKIAEKDVPAAVLSAFKSAYPHAKILGASTETEHDSTYYEIESKDGKVRRDILYAADGTVAETEETIAARSLPDEVKKALDKDFPKARIEKVELLTKGSAKTYELKIRSGKKVKEVQFDPSGKQIIEDEEEGEEEENERDGQ